MLRPGEPPTIEIATQIFNNLFFSSDNMIYLMLESEDEFKTELRLF